MVISLGGKASFAAEAGDRIRVETPGGGGFGSQDSDKHSSSTTNSHPTMHISFPRASGSLATLEEQQLDF